VSDVDLDRVRLDLTAWGVLESDAPVRFQLPEPALPWQLKLDSAATPRNGIDGADLQVGPRGVLVLAATLRR